jgi:hypothetical protein
VTSCPRAARTRTAVWGLLLALGARAAGAAPDEGSWRISLRGLDVTREADPLQSGGALLVNAAALAPSLRLQVRIAGREAMVRDIAGVDWRGEAGDALLTSPGRGLNLSRPLRIEGRSVYLPVEAVAELAGLGLSVDPDARTAAFTDPQPAASPAGWKTFSRPKPSPPGGIDRKPPQPRQDLRLPPTHDTLRVGLGVGAVPGTDGGAELTATGSVRSFETGLNSVVTTGPEGLEILSGHAVLTDAERGWGAEAGDLFTDLWGAASGARFRLQRGQGDRASWPALSVYLEHDRRGNQGTVFAYHDELRLGRSTLLEGEIASDGSWVMSGRVRRERMSLFGYYRNASGRFDAQGEGLAASFQASVSRSGSGRQRLDGRSFSLRYPFRAGFDAAVESTRSQGLGLRNRIDALVTSAAFGRLQIRNRYQRRQTEVALSSLARPLSLRQDELFTSVSWLAGSRLRLEVQLAERWSERGIREEWRQINAFYSFSPRLSLQLFAASSSTGLADTFRLRLDREISSGLSVYAEYGDVVTFQSLAPGEDRSRFRVMVRRTWDVATPASGSAVEGIVGSSAGLPTSDLPVQLGPYRTVTDTQGRYAFANVPPGRYELSLPADGLPANTAAGPPAAVQVKRGRAQQADLAVVPLSEVHGWAYVDRNGDGRRGPAEELGGVVVTLGQWTTSSAPDGSFAFFNLPAGPYQLRIEAGRLPKGLAAASPLEMSLGLPPGRSVDHLELRFEEKRMPVVLQETSRWK